MIAIWCRSKIGKSIIVLENYHLHQKRDYLSPLYPKVETRTDSANENDLLYNVQSTVAHLFHALRAQKWLSHKVKVIHLATYESYREYNKCQFNFIFFLYNIENDWFSNLNNINLQFILNQLNYMELSILLKSDKFIPAYINLFLKWQFLTWSLRNTRKSKESYLFLQNSVIKLIQNKKIPIIKKRICNRQFY